MNRGYLYLGTTEILWSLFPIVTILTVNLLPSLYSAALSMGIASLLFAAWLTIGKKWKELASKKVWKYLAAIILLNGVGYYGLVFIGLSKTTATNGSIVLLMEVFFTYLFFGAHDKVNRYGVLGAALMLLGAGMVLFPKSSAFQGGELYLIVATMLAPFGNHFQKKARKLTSSQSILFARTSFSFILLLIAGRILQDTPTWGMIHSSLILLLLNGLLFLGINKIFWIEALHRLPITTANAWYPFVPLLTLVFAFFILHEVPTAVQLLGFIPTIIGAQIVLKSTLIKP